MQNPLKLYNISVINLINYPGKIQVEIFKLNHCPEVIE